MSRWLALLQALLASTECWLLHKAFVACCSQWAPRTRLYAFLTLCIWKDKEADRRARWGEYISNWGEIAVLA